MRRMLARFGAWLDDLLFPQDVACLCCDRALDDEARNGVCRSCRKELERLADTQEMREKQNAHKAPEGIEYIHAAFAYEGAARRLIHRLKYESVRAAAVPLAEQMALLPSGEEEIIVPVPTDRKRLRKRGFNQASLLAEHIADTLGMQMEEAIVRVNARLPQTGLSARERRENLVGCMAASDAVNGRRVLLVDDVCTTGATAAEAARALLAAGARSVGVFAAARPAGDRDEETDPFALPQRH